MKLTKEQQLLQQVVHRAWEDDSFKQELMVNPTEAIEKLTGERVQLPEGKTLAVVDQTDTSVVYINIPAKQNMDDMELNEDQLEAVAGGADLSLIYIDPKFPPIWGGEGRPPDDDIFIRPGDYL